MEIAALVGDAPGWGAWMVRAAGLACLALAVLHCFFPRLFRWREQLPRVSRANAGVMQVMNIVLTGCLLLFAAVLLVHTDAMITTALGRTLLGALALLWLLRAALQRPYFSAAGPAVTLGFELYFVLTALMLAVPLLLG